MSQDHSELPGYVHLLGHNSSPSYALIILDNRDEFILRPTSRPHWWSSRHQRILSSRDLQRAEQGTWLGVTKTGNLAVLTNYREAESDERPIQGTRSRGGMVTAWLTSPEDESIDQFVHGLLEGEGVKNVGGFSLVCGKLRRRRGMGQELEPLAIVSNRSGSPDDVSRIGGKRGEVYGLSNTSYDDPVVWPKVKMGKEKLLSVVKDVVEGGSGEEELVERLYALLDTDTLPAREGRDFDALLYQLKKSIFIPPIGQVAAPPEIKSDITVATVGTSKPKLDGNAAIDADLEEEETPDPQTANAVTGVYGTQRQTIMLVDWEGHVTYRERSLWDELGRPIERGKGDVKFEFQIDGWQDESKGNEDHPHSVL